MEVRLKASDNALGFLLSTETTRDNILKQAKQKAAAKDKYNQVIISILTNQFNI